MTSGIAIDSEREVSISARLGDVRKALSDNRSRKRWLSANLSDDSRPPMKPLRHAVDSAGQNAHFIYSGEGIKTGSQQ
jgi:hypothetical protein